MNTVAIAAEIVPALTVGGRQIPSTPGQESFEDHLGRALGVVDAGRTKGAPPEGKPTQSDKRGTPVPAAVPGMNLMISPSTKSTTAPLLALLTASGGPPGSPAVPQGKGVASVAPPLTTGGHALISATASLLPDESQPLVTGPAGKSNIPPSTSKPDEPSDSEGTAERPGKSGLRAKRVAGDSSAQDEAQVRGAVDSLENASLSALAASLPATDPALPGILEGKANSLLSAAARRATAAPKNIPSKPMEEASTQAPAKAEDGASAETATSSFPKADPVHSAKAGSQPVVTSKDGVQDGSGKSSDSSRPLSQSTGSVNATAGSSAASSATQAFNGIPVVLNQPGAPAASATRTGALNQAPASQPVAEKIAAAIEGPASTAGAVVNTAALIQGQGKTEMHVALHTESLGPLQLRTVLDNGTIGASIAVVSHDAHTLLTNNLPSLQQVLAEQNLRLDHLAIINSPMTSGAGTGDSGNFHPGDFSQSGDRNARWFSTSQTPALTSSATDPDKPAILRGRLSVRA